MFENRQLAVLEGKFHRFRNSSECLKTHCASIIDQCGRKTFFRSFFQKYFVVHEQSPAESSFSTCLLFMLYPGRFILVESVVQQDY